MSNPYAVLSPQAPPDILPVPWQERPISDVGAPSNVVKALADEFGIYTIGDIPEDFDLTSCPGVGPATAETMRGLIAAYQES